MVGVGGVGGVVVVVGVVGVVAYDNEMSRSISAFLGSFFKSFDISHLAQMQS